jgi:hypothetical protein
VRGLLGPKPWWRNESCQGSIPSGIAPAARASKLPIKQLKMKLFGRVLRKKAKVGKLLRVTAGGRHGWFNSSVGIIRKPLSAHEAKNN